MKIIQKEKEEWALKKSRVTAGTKDFCLLVSLSLYYDVLNNYLLHKQREDKSSMIFIYSTFPNKKEAGEIGEGLVQKRLAACVNIFSIDSIYFWQGKLVKDKEFAAIIKTKKENFEKVEKFILKKHIYDTPCIIEIPLGRITKKYLNWLNKSLSV